MVHNSFWNSPCMAFLLRIPLAPNLSWCRPETLYLGQKRITEKVAGPWSMPCTRARKMKLKRRPGQGATCAECSAEPSDNRLGSLGTATVAGIDTTTGPFGQTAADAVRLRQCPANLTLPPSLLCSCRPVHCHGRARNSIAFDKRAVGFFARPPESIATRAIVHKHALLGKPLNPRHAPREGSGGRPPPGSRLARAEGSRSAYQSVRRCSRKVGAGEVEPHRPTLPSHHQHAYTPLSG